MKRVVINVAEGRWYPRGQKRLAEAVAECSPGVDFLGFEGYPPESPTHQEVPYAFKTYAVFEAIRRGYNSILWLDASAWPIKDLAPLFETIEAQGSVHMRSGWGFGQWASDAALKVLQLQRDDVMDRTLVQGGLFGVCPAHESARNFLEWLTTLAEDGRVFRGPWKNGGGEASADPRCLGHRHDMVAMSHIVHELQLPVFNPPRFWSVWTETPHVDALVLARGM